MAREEERLVSVRPQSFVNAVAEKEAMIENGNSRIGVRSDDAVDADHEAIPDRQPLPAMEFSALSLSSRCFSFLEIRFSISIGGSRPK
jgi:hypothetical protein